MFKKKRYAYIVAFHHKGNIGSWHLLRRKKLRLKDIEEIQDSINQEYKTNDTVIINVVYLGRE